jgi:hypothetical protein
MSENLKAKLAKIEARDHDLLQLVKQLIGKKDDMYLTDMFLIGAMKRTVALSQGFRTHIRERNFTCASTLMRAQLDTALRVNAIFLCSDPEAFTTDVLFGSAINKMKGREGKQLSDAYLAEKLSETYPWVNEVYKNLCEVGHFSSRHITSAIVKMNDDTRSIDFHITAFDPPLPEEDYFEIVECFYETMHITGIIAAEWHTALRAIRTAARPTGNA